MAPKNNSPNAPYARPHDPRVDGEWKGPNRDVPTPPSGIYPDQCPPDGRPKTPSIGPKRPPGPPPKPPKKWAPNLPHGYMPPLNPHATPAVAMHDIFDPTRVLRNITKKDVDSRFLNHLDAIDGFLNTFNPSQQLRNLFKEVCGRDLYEPILEAFAGDWESWGRYAIFWDDMSKVCDQMYQNLSYGNEALRHYWDGRANDAAYIYFHELAWDLFWQSENFADLSTKYAQVVGEVKGTASLVSGLINDLNNYVLIAGGGLLLAASGVGSVLGALTAAGAAGLAIKAVWKLVGHLDDLKKLVDSTGLTVVMVPLKGHPGVHELPVNAYSG